MIAALLLTTVILGDSIAHGTHLPGAQNLAVDGNTIFHTTEAVARVPPGKAYIHVGVNDIMRDNINAQVQLDRLLQAIRRRPDVYFVVDQIGPLRPSRAGGEREALRAKMNMQLRLARAPNLKVTPFVITSFYDGFHPDAAGYAQQLPIVIAALNN